MKQLFNDSAVGALEFTISWEKDGIQHEEWYLGRKFNPVNDIFPRGMREALEGKTEGESVTLTYEPRLCIPRHKDSLVRHKPLDKLRKKTLKGRPIIPRIGRFYPQGHISGILDVYPDTLTPFRLVQLDGESFTADCNHPLALIPITIQATIQYIELRDTGTYGNLTHWREKTCDWGPGMQTRLKGKPTDFFRDGFFDTVEDDSGSITPTAVDATALQNLERIQARHVLPDMRVLDFSLGNSGPEGIYDAAICTLSMEYMTEPIETLKRIAEHLQPGSPIVIGFTNHFDEKLAIDGWIDMHDFERMGLVLEYLRQAGLDDAAKTYSMRNDWRPKDDPLFLETRGVSDPVYVVVGHKQ